MNNPVEHLQSRWLGGRGTRFLYFAIILTIVGVLWMSAGGAGARAEEPKVAVDLAVEVAHLCSGADFAKTHPSACAKAEAVLGGGALGGPADQVNAVGVSR